MTAQAKMLFFNMKWNGHRIFTDNNISIITICMSYLRRFEKNCGQKKKLDAEVLSFINSFMFY